MGENRHGHHRIWREIQQLEAVGINNVAEELGEGGQSPQ
jgi:hypothetical protein